MDASFNLSYGLSADGLYGGTIASTDYEGSEDNYYNSLALSDWNGSPAYALDGATLLSGVLVESGTVFGEPIMEIGLGLEGYADNLGNPEMPALELDAAGTSGTLIESSDAGFMVLPALELSAGGVSVGNAADSGDMDLPGLQLDADWAISGGDLQIGYGLTGEIGNGAIGAGPSDWLELPALSVEAEASSSDTGQLAAGEMALQLRVEASALNAAAASAQFDAIAISLQATAINAAAGTASFSLPAIDLEASAFEQAQIGSALLEIPLLVDGATVPLAWTAAGTALVMNARNGAVTTYSDFGFNSFARFDGAYYAMGAAGLYALGGADDDGAAIEAVLALPVSDMGATALKRVTAAYVAYRANGPLELRMKADDDGWYSYVMDETRIGGIYRNRVKTGRGALGNYWQAEIRNVNGSDFAIDKIELEVEPVSRKVA